MDDVAGGSKRLASGLFPSSAGVFSSLSFVYSEESELTVSGFISLLENDNLKLFTEECPY